MSAQSAQRRAGERAATQLLGSLTADDLRRLMVFLQAQVAMVRGATYVDALVDACAGAGLPPPPADADPIAWVDQELAALARALTTVMNARGALG